MPLSRGGDKPPWLATIPVVLCVVFYGAYRFITVIPWGGYDPGFDAVERALVGVIITALGVVQVRFAFRRPSRSGAGLLLAAQVLLSYGPFLVFGTRWDPPAAFVVASVLLTFTGRFSWAMAALAVVGDVAVGIALEPGTVHARGDIVAMRVAYCAVVAIANGLLLFGMSRLSALVRDLDATRAAGASLEVARERLRFAGHLQDSLGGRLASIIATLRCADGETGRPAEQTRVVAATARQALAQVRAVADNHRDRSLAGEVAAVRTVLTAAGVDVTVGSVPDGLPTPVDLLLAAILRRTVIDALRGAPPQRCWIELDGSARMRVRFAGGEPGAPGDDGTAEEVRRLGGRLRVGPGPGTTGEVDVLIPVHSGHPGRTRSRRPVAAAPWLAFGIMAVLEVLLLVATISRATEGWHDHTVATAGQAVAIVLIVPLSLLQLHHVRPRGGSPPRWWRWTLTVQILFVCAIAVIGSPIVTGAQYAGPVAGVVLFHVRRPWSWALAGGLVVGTAAWDLHSYGVDITANLARNAWLTLLSLPWTLLAMVATAALCHLLVAAEQLVRARQELARLAVLRERLRIARDTHDLLGFQLSAVALKAELAGRLAATDPDASRIQRAEAAQIAEEALHSLRSITAEPAGLSFAAEVERARSMLTAAGTRVTIELRATPGPAVESPLAIVLREAVTNVIRHSRATMCEIETRPVPGGLLLRVANNGVPSGAPEAVAGNGLANLAARAREAGGQLNIHRQGEEFTLLAEVRSDQPAPAVPVAV